VGWGGGDCPLLFAAILGNYLGIKSFWAENMKSKGKLILGINVAFNNLKH